MEIHIHFERKSLEQFLSFVRHKYTLHFSQSMRLLPLHPSILHLCGIAISLGCGQWSKSSYQHSWFGKTAGFVFLFRTGQENWVGQRVAFSLSQLCIVLPLHVPERTTNPWCSSFYCPELLPTPYIQSMDWQDSLKLDEEWLLLATFSFGRPYDRGRWESPSCHSNHEVSVDFDTLWPINWDKCLFYGAPSINNVRCTNPNKCRGHIDGTVVVPTNHYSFPGLCNSAVHGAPSFFLHWWLRL